MRRKLFMLTLLMLSAFTGYCFSYPGYTVINSFLIHHPKQLQIMESFSKEVSSPSVPIGIRMTAPVRIAVVYPGLQKSDYWRDSVKSMKSRLDELGIRYELDQYFSKPSGDYRLQVTQLAQAVSNHCDYLALSVDNENIKRLVTGILAKKQPKIFIQNLTTPLKIWNDNPPLMYVGFDHIMGSKMLADHYAKLLPKGGKYIMLYGAQGTVSTLRGDSFEDYAMTKGFVPAAKYYTDFSSDKAYRVVKEALAKHPDVSFIYACSTDIAIGASKALAEMGLTGKVLVNGWGGTLNELDLIKQKKLDFTVMRMNDDNGVAIAEAIKYDILGKDSMIPRIFSGQFVTVTKYMSNAAINNLIERALRYSGK